MMLHHVTFPNQQKNMDDLERDLLKYGTTPADAKHAILKAAALSETMIRNARDHVAGIVQGQRTEWIPNYNEDPLLKKWFGLAEQPNHVLAVHNGLESARNRMSKGLLFNLRPAVRKTTNAKANGTYFSSRSLRVYPVLFLDGTDPEQIAVIFVKELLQIWFPNQRINGKPGNTEAVAIQLAREAPGIARKNAENYKRYCLELNAM